MAPLLAGAQFGQQGVERRFVLGRELEPGEKVERLAEIARVVKPPRDGRQVLHRESDMPRPVLEDRPAFVLRHRPPCLGLADRDQRGTGRLGAAEARLHGSQVFQFGGRGVASMADDAAQHPPARGKRRLARCDGKAGHPLQAVADDCRDVVDLPLARRAGGERDDEGRRHARLRARRAPTSAICGLGPAGVAVRCPCQRHRVRRWRQWRVDGATRRR